MILLEAFTEPFSSFPISLRVMVRARHGDIHFTYIPETQARMQFLQGNSLDPQVRKAQDESPGEQACFKSV